MNRSLVRRGGGLTLIAVLAGLVVAAPSGAVHVSGEQFSVIGKQTLIGNDVYRMSGGLLGKWEVTSFKVVAVKPIFRGKGTESFNGCIDVKRDGSCAGDPSGTMKFSFRYWAQLDQDGKVQLGTCSHPVTGGSGDFANATGFLMMVDTPINKPPFTVSRYQGTITLGPLVTARAGGAPHC